MSIHLNSSSILSTEDNAFEKQVEIYPNPELSSLNIVIDEDKSTLYIYNSLGKTVISDYNLTTGTNVIELDFDSGIYVITIENEDILKRQKILIQ